MTVRELSRDMLVELKQSYLSGKLDAVGQCISYDELADADELITDAEVFAEYQDFDFSEDDFWCSCNPALSSISP